MHLGGDGFNGRKRWAPERFAAGRESWLVEDLHI